MIVLTFTLPAGGSGWRETWLLPANSDPAMISEMDLRYKYFGAKVEMTVNGVFIISPIGHLPLIDLGLSFRAVESRLALGEDAAFGFTERPEVIRIRGAGPTVSIESSDMPKRAAETDRSSLIAELARFRESFYQRLVEEVAGIERNPVVQHLRSPV